MIHSFCGYTVEEIKAMEKKIADLENMLSMEIAKNNFLEARVNWQVSKAIKQSEQRNV
tara:strand:+ start:112 stop:285 length:174 start_codon:yes stop_codon:yes gene_type:complete